MIRQLNRDEQDRLHHRYRESDLFRHWSPLLCRMEWEMQEVDMVTLWCEAEKILQQLRQTQDNRDEMIPYIMKRLLSDFRTIQDENGVSNLRTPEQAERSAVSVMCIVLTSLINAVESGHEDEHFENEPMCVAIVGPLRSHPHFKFLMDTFFSRKMGNDGKKVVIKPSDPMMLQAVIDDMDDEARKEMETMKGTILQHTQGLKALFGDYWQHWEQLCSKVCLDFELIGKLKDVNPRHNEWGINQKMICNIIGLFITTLQVSVSINNVSKAISEKRLNSYLSNHADYSGSDSALSKTDHKKIEQMLV